MARVERSGFATAPRIGYLVHDLNDAAVARRVIMLRRAGLRIDLAGFSRLSPPMSVEGVEAHCLGRTSDNRLGERVFSILKAVARARRIVARSDVLLARNLEMLVLAVVLGRGRRIVYECLDIHRTLVGTGRASRIVQFVERRLLRRTDLVLTSSPRFVSEHFAKTGVPVPTMLVENKVLALDGVRPQPSVRPYPTPDAPWTIGWFGMLRCRRSLAILSSLAAASVGRIEVVIAGKPSTAEFDDFAGQVARAPGVRFVGAYTADDLARLYASVDFAWAIDYFEEGENSTWLLPNRLYEASAHGAVPIALDGVETGAWLRRHAAGVVVGDPAAEIGALLTSLDADGYAALRDAVRAIPAQDLLATHDDCTALAQAVTGSASA